MIEELDNPKKNCKNIEEDEYQLGFLEEKEIKSEINFECNDEYEDLFNCEYDKVEIEKEESEEYSMLKQNFKFEVIFFFFHVFFWKTSFELFLFFIFILPVVNLFIFIFFFLLW